MLVRCDDGKGPELRFKPCGSNGCHELDYESIPSLAQWSRFCTTAALISRERAHANFTAYGDVMLCDDHHKLKYTSSDALNRSLALSEDPAYNPFEYYKNKRSVKPLGGLSRLSAEEEAELKLKAEAALEIHRRQVWKNTSAATPGVPSPAKRPRGSSPIVKSSAKPRTFEDLPAFVKELDDIVHLSNTAMPNIVVNTQQLLWFLRRS